MVVCKFFQQGYCRYGQSCRFEHIYGTKYTYQAPQQPAPSTNTVTDEQLLNVVHADTQSVLKSGQWLLSCYAPFKEKPLFPGFVDLSPEEARLYFYEAKAKNTLNEAATYMTQLEREAKEKYEMLLQVNPTLTKVLRRIYQGETVSTTPFTNTTQPSMFESSNSAASSIFRSAAQNTTSFGQAPPNTSGFGQTGSVFGSPTAAQSIFAQANQNAFPTNQSPNVFGQQNNTSPAVSIFAQANQNLLNTQTPPTNPSNIFASANHTLIGQQDSPVQQQSSSPFAQNSSPFGQTNSFCNAQNQASNVFASPSPFGQQTSQNVFAIPEQHTQNVFGVNVFEQRTEALDIYSKMEDLSQEDLEAFNSDSFQLGFIPEMPPPRELCI